MLKGDISKLATMCNCSVSTIYNVADKLGIDLHPIHYRRDKTIDFVSGKTLADEQAEWLSSISNKIIQYRQEKKIKNAKKIIAVKERSHEQFIIA